MTDTLNHKARSYMEVLRIAVPLAVANLMLVGNSVVDHLMIGQLGISEIAGATLSIQLYLLLVVFGEGIVSAFTPLYSAARGRGSIKAQGTILLGALLLSVMLFALAAGVMWNSSSVLIAIGVAEDLTELAKSYGKVVTFSILPALVSVIVWEIASIHDKARWVTASSLVGFLANILLNWLFIRAGWGLPGVALATLLSNCIVIACTLVVMIPVIASLLPYMRQLRRGILEIPRLIRLGLPIGGIELATVGFFVSSTYLMSVETSEIIAAHAIAYQVTELAIVLVLGFGEAATILIANAFGGSDWSRLKRTAASITVSCLATSAIVSLSMVALSAWLPVLFVGSTATAQATRSMATVFILIGATFTILDALQIAWLGVLRGMQDTLVPLVLVMIGYWVVGVPVGYVLAHPLGLGPTGIWWGLSIGLAFTCLGLGWRIVRRLTGFPAADIRTDGRSSKMQHGETQ